VRDDLDGCGHVDASLNVHDDWFSNEEPSSDDHAAAATKHGRSRTLSRLEFDLFGNRESTSQVGDGNGNAGKNIDGYECAVLESAKDRFDAVVSCMARRVYTRICEGDKRPVPPPLLAHFDEERFLAKAGEINGASKMALDTDLICVYERLKCLNPFSYFWSEDSNDTCQVGAKNIAEETVSTVTSGDVVTYIKGFAKFTDMPMDLLLVALLYIDRLVGDSHDDRSTPAHGLLTARSWKPVVTVAMVLASKSWEDICIQNFEAAQYAGYTPRRMLRLELLAMDSLGWSTHISAEEYAPYVWTMRRDLEGCRQC
jgi:hypothetical protein